MDTLDIFPSFLFLFSKGSQDCGFFFGGKFPSYTYFQNSLISLSSRWASLENAVRYCC